jgi:formate dehydrogenase major subunit
MTKTAELAEVVFPASNSAFETEGTVTNSERRVQRCRAALTPPGNAKDDVWIINQVARRLKDDWIPLEPQQAWDELRTLSPMHGGMSWERLEELGGLQWPCPDENHPGTPILHTRLWEFDDPETQGTKAPFSVVIDDPPVDLLDQEFPLRLTTGRRLDSYNTGVQTGGYTSPLRRGESLDISPEDARTYGVSEGDVVAVSSRRGTVRAPVHLDPALRPGLVFMTFHFPDEVDTNVLTIEATDPRSGTAEFKATAVRIDKVDAAVGAE